MLRCVRTCEVAVEQRRGCRRGQGRASHLISGAGAGAGGWISSHHAQVRARWQWSRGEDAGGGRASHLISGAGAGAGGWILSHHAQVRARWQWSRGEDAGTGRVGHLISSQVQVQEQEDGSHLICSGACEVAVEQRRGCRRGAGQGRAWAHLIQQAAELTSQLAFPGKPL